MDLGPFTFNAAATIMGAINNATASKLAHYQAWSKSWLSVEPSKLPSEECLAIITREGPQWLNEVDPTTPVCLERMIRVVACFKTAANARVIHLGGELPPSCDECDVLSENFDARVKCSCPGLFPVASNHDTNWLKSCGCLAVERMATEAELVNAKEDEWNTSAFFSANGLTSAIEELALCHADMQPAPASCCSDQGELGWAEVKAPDRKPSAELDLDEKTYAALYPTHERIRLSADAKYFFAIASGVSLVDPGIQMAIADSGNDILIGDYCDAATEESLVSLQRLGAAAFAFLKLSVYAGWMTDVQFNHLVAQTIQFRVISYWRDHALSRRPRGVYGSRMTGMRVHRHIDLAMTVGVVCASMATGQDISADEFGDLVDTSVLINDLVDFRGDTWRNQRENVVLRGVRGCLCEYLDGLLTECIGGAAVMVGRGKTFALLTMCFCNWMLMSSGHKVYELLHGLQPSETSTPCHYKSENNGNYEQLLQALEPYGTLGEDGPRIDMTRKDLQMRYAHHRESPESHIRWTADAVRIILHPGNLRHLVDVVHYPWTGDLGNVNYCA